MNPKFIKTKKRNDSNVIAFLKYKKLKNQTIYDKLCVVIKEKLGVDTYKIQVAKDYLKFDLKKMNYTLFLSFN